MALVAQNVLTWILLIGIVLVLTVGVLLDVLSFMSSVQGPSNGATAQDRLSPRHNRASEVFMFKMETIRNNVVLHLRDGNADDIEHMLLERKQEKMSRGGEKVEYLHEALDPDGSKGAWQIISNSTFNEQDLLELDTISDDWNILSEGDIPGQHASPVQHITCVTKLVKDFIVRLKTLRKEYVAEALEKPVEFKQHRTTVNASDPDYFSAINRHSGVDTVYLKTPKSVISKCMIPFHRPANSAERNCNIPPGNNNDELTGAEPMEDSDLSIELPPHVPHDPRNITSFLTYIHIVRHAVATTQGHVLSSDLEITVPVCDSVEQQVHEPSVGETVYKEIFTLAQPDTGHDGDIHVLTRLMPYIPFLKQYPHIKIHISGGADQYFRALGLAKSRVITGDVQGKIVYVPATASHCMRNTFRTQLLSLYLHRSLQNLWHQRDTIILLQRPSQMCEGDEDKLAKDIQNIAALGNLHFWMLPDLQVDDQAPPCLPEVAAMFNQALVVVAPSRGSQQVLFSQPGMAMVEGVAGDGGCHEHLVQAIGGYYEGVIGGGECLNITHLARPTMDWLHHVRQEIKLSQHP